MSGRVTLVAHRGQPDVYPENSLQGFRHALNAGARFIETDVQITSDAVPVLSHDAHLLRLTGKQIIVADHDFQQIQSVAAGYPERFADQYADYRIAALSELAGLLKPCPDVTAFIELKQAAINNFGMKAVDLIIQALKPVMRQIVLISFNDDALAYAASQHQLTTGWVLPEWSEENRRQAEKLKPRYLFLDQEMIGEDAWQGLWPGPWKWVAYTLNDAQSLQQLVAVTGIELIETDRYSALKQESSMVDTSNDF